MLMQKKLTQNRKIAYIVVIILLSAASLYVLYVSFFEIKFSASYDPDESTDPAQTEVSQDQPITANVDYEKIEFTDSFFKKAPYINLKPAPVSRVSTTVSGRLDPFSQVQAQSPTSTKP